MKCSVIECDNDAVISWQRYATSQEIADHVPSWHDSMGSTILIYACADHALTMERMAMIHQEACPAPPACTCPEPVFEPSPAPQPPPFTS